MSASKIITLITGANQGVGFEVVKALSHDPSHHVIMGCRSLTKAKEAISRLSDPSNTEPLELEVTSDESIAAAIKSVESTHGHLDVLINNAGIGWGPFTKDTPRREVFEKTLSTNTISAAILTDASLPLLQKSSSPRIIFVSSALGSITETLDPKAAHFGYDTPLMPYKASKAAMNMIAAHYSTALRDEPFKVNACTPGLSATNFTSGVGRDPSIGAEIIVRLAKGDVEGTGGYWVDEGRRLPW